MSVTLGDAVMYLEADDRDLKQGLKKADSRIKRFAKKSQQVLKTAMKVGLLGAAAGIAAGAAIAVKSIMQAADAEEMLSKLHATFGAATKKLQADLDAFAKATGRSRFELQGMAADMGAVFKAMGFTEEGAAALAKQTTQLSVDLGSFNNLPSEDVANRLTRAYTGEFESLKALGIVINEVALNREMEIQGMEGAYSSLDQLTKASLINGIIMKQTTDAQGDAEKTSGSFTNQMIALKATISDVTTEIGLKLLPVVTPLVKKFGEFAKEVLPKVVFWVEHNLIPAFSWLLSLIEHQILPGFKKITDFIKKVLGPVFDMLGKGATFLGGTLLSGLVPPLEEVAKVVQDEVRPAFDGWSVALLNRIPEGVKRTTDALIKDLIPRLGDAAEALRQVAAADVEAEVEIADLTAWQTFVVWIGTKLVPALVNLGALFAEGVPIAIDMLKTHIDTVLVPMFEDFIDSVVEGVGPMLEDLVGWFDDLLEPIGGVSGAISALIGLVEGLMFALETAELPWWLVKKSPTPFEKGLRGISAALEKELNPQLGKFAVQLQAAGMGGLGGATDARDYSRTTRVDQMTIMNGRDEQGIMQVLRNMSRI